MKKNILRILSLSFLSLFLASCTANSPDEARQSEDNTPTTGSIALSIDWVSEDASKSERIAFAPPANAPDVAYIVVDVRDSNFNSVTQVSFPTASANSGLISGLAPGSYNLVIIGSRNSAGTDIVDAKWTLGVGVTAGDTTQPAPVTMGYADDAGDFPGNSATIPNNDWQEGSISTVGDVDCYQFSAIAGTTYTIETSGSMDAYIYLADIDGLLDTDDDSGLSTNSQISWDCLTSGTYYVMVSDYGNNDTGNYVLYLMDEDTDEHGNTPAAASQIYEDATPISGSVSPAGDIDFFVFSGISNHTYTIQTSGNTDTVLTFIAGAQTWDDDDSGVGSNALLTMNIFTTMDFYIAVEHFSSSGTGDYALSITDDGLYDTEPPTVDSTSPSDGAQSVAVNATISATFDDFMDSDTLTSSTFTLDNGATGTVSYDSGSKTATFTPSSNLAGNTLYTATLSTAVTDRFGNNLASAYIWSFTTTAAGDTTPPTVSSTSPSNGAQNVAVGATISATFDEPMDSSTLTSSTFTLDNGATGTVSYNSGTYTATFTPSGGLNYGTMYTATITTGVAEDRKSVV